MLLVNRNPSRNNNHTRSRNGSQFEESLSSTPPDSDFKINIRWNHILTEYEIPITFSASKFNGVEVSDLKKFIDDCGKCAHYNVAKQIYRPSNLICLMQCSPIIMFGLIMIVLSLSGQFELLPFFIVPLFFMVCGMT